MASTITANRYSFLSQETNLPVGDLKKFTDGSILNSVNNEFKGFNQSLTDMIAGINSRLNIDGLKSELKAVTDPITSQIQTLKDAKDEAQATIKAASNTVDSLVAAANQEVNTLKATVGSLADNQVIRDAKGIYGSVRDIAQLGNKAVEKVIGSQLPKGSALEKAFSGMTDACKASAFKQGNFGKPFKPSISCGGKTRNTSAKGCDSGQFNDVINKLTGNAYNAAYSDLTATLNGLVNLTNFGYKMNMCGVFGALSNGIADKNLLTRAGASIFGTTAAGGSILNALDLAGATAGLPIINEFPGVIKSLVSGIKLYDDTPVWRITGVAQATTEMFDSLDPNWNKDDTGEVLSVEKLTNKNPDEIVSKGGGFAALIETIDAQNTQSELADLFDVQGLNNDIDVDDLDSASDSNITYLASVTTNDDAETSSGFTW